MTDFFNNDSVGEGFSSVDLVYQCLIDKDKVESFEKVLKRHIKSDSNVLDVGTGTGILALLAGRLGAEKVTALEFDPAVAKIASNNIKQNNLDNKIKVITGDARIIDFSGNNFDIIIMELLATGLVDEMQVEAINNLYNQKLISSNTTVIPFAQENYLAICNANFDLYGFNMKMIKHLWAHDKDDGSFELLSGKLLMNKVIFNKQNSLKFSEVINFKANKDAVINSLCLTSKILVDSDNEVVLDSTHSLNPIVFIPLEEKKIKADEEIKIKIEYVMGGGFNNFNVNYLI